MKINEFLESLESSSSEKGAGKLLGEGKENDKVDQKFRDALKEAGVNYEWVYKPDDRDMVVAELKGAGDNNWGIYTFGSFKTDEEVNKLFDKDVMKRINEIEFDDDDDEDVEVGTEKWEVSGKYTDNFLNVVKECISIAKSDQFKSDKDGVQDNELPQNFKKV
jgi:hypothetical protein